MTTEQIRERLEANVEPEPNSGCWIWIGRVVNSGYGTLGSVRPTKKPVYAHRASWMLANERDPGRFYVLHRCDNRQCINPSHLFLGTSADNHRDACQKGRKIAAGVSARWRDKTIEYNGPKEAANRDE